MCNYSHLIIIFFEVSALSSSGSQKTKGTRSSFSARTENPNPMSIYDLHFRSQTSINQSIAGLQPTKKAKYRSELYKMWSVSNPKCSTKAISELLPSTGILRTTRVCPGHPHSNLSKAKSFRFQPLCPIPLRRCCTACSRASNRRRTSQTSAIS
jgi:hypothetical protein